MDVHFKHGIQINNKWECKMVIRKETNKSQTTNAGIRQKNQNIVQESG